MALRNIKREAGGQRGRSAAVVRIVLGCIGIVFTATVYEPQSVTRERYRRISCASNLNVIGRACLAYGSDNEELFPDDLSLLYPEYVNTLDIFRCPSAGDKVLSPERIEQDGSYVYVHGVAGNDLKDTLLMYDKPTSHNAYRNPGRNELYLDGHVEWKPDDKQD